MREGLTVVLPPDLAALVAAKVASGEYASADAVVQAALEELELRDAEGLLPELPQGAAFDEMLRREVVPAMERFERGESEVIPLAEVMARLRAGRDRR